MLPVVVVFVVVVAATAAAAATGASPAILVHFSFQFLLCCVCTERAGKWWDGASRQKAKRICRGNRYARLVMYRARVWVLRPMGFLHVACFR